LQLFSFGVYGLALAALVLVVFGAYDSYPYFSTINKALSWQKYVEIEVASSSPIYSMGRDVFDIWLM